jgi:hypothetical protein
VPVERVTTQPRVQTLTFLSGQRITIEKQDVQVVVRGIQGPSGPQGLRGIPGSAGTPRIEMPFSFGDATPANLFTAIAGKLIERITLYIETAFDGETPSLTIVDEDNSAILMEAFENNPSEEAAYQVTPNLYYETDTPILLFISPGLGASQGSGLVVVEMQT